MDVQVIDKMCTKLYTVTLYVNGYDVIDESFFVLCTENEAERKKQKKSKKRKKHSVGLYWFIIIN